MGLGLKRQAELIGSGLHPLLRILGFAAHWFAAGVFGKDAFGLLAEAARAAHCPDLIAGRAGGVLGWLTFAGLSALTGLVLGAVIVFLLHKVLGLGHDDEAHAEAH